MKNLLIILLLLFIACSPKPEFYIDGKPYYTKQVCIKDTTYQKYEYHYGYYLGEFKNHWGYHEVRDCLEFRTDTIEIKE